MKAIDLHQHFLANEPWVDGPTVDGVIYGDPNLDTDRCLVAWMPGMDAFRAMVEKGIRLLVCHESIFFNHQDDRPRENESECMLKKRFLDEHGITVLRNHDGWDRWPDIGIPSAWARFLDLPFPPAKDHYGFQRRHDITPVPLGDFARRVAGRCAELGEWAVQVTGDLSTPVSRIGVGCGCICSLDIYRDMGVDCAIVCDDGSGYCHGIQRWKDEGRCVIRVNHCTSEDPGIRLLADYINQTIPGLKAEYLQQGACFQLVGKS